MKNCLKYVLTFKHCISARKDLNTWANSSQVQQVIEMGFSRHAVYGAIQTLGNF